MGYVVKKITANYDNYKMIETIYLDSTYTQFLVNAKTNKVLYTNSMDRAFQSTSKQLQRYLKYLVNTKFKNNSRSTN